MKRRFFAALSSALLLCAIAAGSCAQTLYIDNRETDKQFPERLNFRAEPSASGDLLGLYYSGTHVEKLEDAENGYAKVLVGGMTGYMASEYLITKEEAESLYEKDSGFYEGRAAQVDLSGLFISRLPVYEKADAKSGQVTRLENGAMVELLGILADEWAYIAAQNAQGEVVGYVSLDALTDVGAYKALIIAGDKADSRLILYSWPNTQAKQIMSLKNGTACFNLFGRSVGGWRKVRVGGETGWIRELYNPGFKLLSETSRAAIPYYPLIMQTKKETLLYSIPGDVGATYMTLGAELKVEVLAESGDYVYVRTYEGGAGAIDCGDYGYIAIGDLSLAQTNGSVGLAQVDNGDLPALVLAQPDAAAELIGALCAGAQVRVTDFTQTDYAQVALGSGEKSVTGYVLKRCLRLLVGQDGELSERIPQRASLIREYELRDMPNEKAGKNPVTVAAGERVYMFGIVNGWAYVNAAKTASLDPEKETADRTGFIELSALNAPASTMYLTAYVNTDKVNMRKEGSASSGIVAKARTGERLLIADYGTEWTCVVTPDGKRGYLMTKYLDFEQMQ